MTLPRVLTGFLLALCLAGCGAKLVPPQTDAVTISLVAPDGRRVPVSVDLARTSAEHQRGLRGRTSLVYGSGMLFIFKESAIQSFWMKDVLIPLDIIFFDESRQAVSMASMEPCAVPVDAVCPSTLSAGPARFALEVPMGFLAAAGVSEDWMLESGPWASME